MCTQFILVLLMKFMSLGPVLFGTLTGSTLHFILSELINCLVVKCGDAAGFEERVCLKEAAVRAGSLRALPQGQLLQKETHWRKLNCRRHNHGCPSSVFSFFFLNYFLKSC